MPSRATRGSESRDAGIFIAAAIRLAGIRAPLTQRGREATSQVTEPKG